MTIVVDANNLLHRVWNITKSLQMKGERRRIWNDLDVDCAPIHAFMRSLYVLVRDYKPRRVYLCWDRRINPEYVLNFRQQLVPEYKAGRKTTPEEREEIMSYISPIASLTTKLGINNFFPWILEADDCIAYIVRNTKGRVVVASSDKDLLQLVDDNVDYHNFTTRGCISVTNFEETCGVEPKHFLRYKAIIGDKSDNIEGLRGYGPKKSKKLACCWADEFEKLSDEQINIVNRNMRVMALAEELNTSETLAYQKQMALEPELNLDSFERTMGRYRFDRNTCNQWSDLLSSIQKEFSIEDFANELFGS
jgi:5'-3' exonuclease